MPPYRQTARMSTGGKAPRLYLSMRTRVVTVNRGTQTRTLQRQVESLLKIAAEAYAATLEHGAKGNPVVLEPEPER